MLRSFIAVFAGYLVFGFSTGLLFRLSHQDPKAWPSMAFGVGSTLYGCVFAWLGGFVAAALAPRNRMGHARVMAMVLASIALISMLAEMGHGSVWSQASALLFMAPCALMGGRARARRG